MLHVNVYPYGVVLLEEEPAGERSLPIELNERAEKFLSALLALESFEVAESLAKLVLAGATAGEQAVPGQP